MMPLPQPVGVQLASQPSPFTRLPSSQVSPARHDAVAAAARRAVGVAAVAVRRGCRRRRARRRGTAGLPNAVAAGRALTQSCSDNRPAFEALPSSQGSPPRPGRRRRSGCRPTARRARPARLIAAARVAAVARRHVAVVASSTLCVKKAFSSMSSMPLPQMLLSATPLAPEPMQISPPRESVLDETREDCGRCESSLAAVRLRDAVDARRNVGDDDIVDGRHALQHVVGTRDDAIREIGAAEADHKECCRCGTLRSPGSSAVWSAVVATGADDGGFAVVGYRHSRRVEVAMEPGRIAGMRGRPLADGDQDHVVATRHDRVVADSVGNAGPDDATVRRTELPTGMYWSVVGRGGRCRRCRRVQP